MERRLDEMAGELETEPALVAARATRWCGPRLEPVGLVYLWPASR
jgi:hypothetical protein